MSLTTGKNYATITPRPVYDETTGYYYLVQDARYQSVKQVILRFDGKNVWLYWKLDKEEKPVPVEEFLAPFK